MTYTPQRVQVFDATSAHSTTLTSNPVFVADFHSWSLTVPVVTASSISVQGSGDDGFTASLTTFSTFTQITTAGVFDIPTTARWVRVVRGSPNSMCEVILQGRFEG